MLRLGFHGVLSDADRETLDELLAAWYLLAEHGVFGGSVHNMDAPAHEQTGDGSECTVGIDLGSGGPAALDPLIQLLLAASDDLSAPLLRLRAEALGD